jgi:hypothetical protein
MRVARQLRRGPSSLDAHASWALPPLSYCLRDSCRRDPLSGADGDACAHNYSAATANARVGSMSQYMRSSVR